MAGNELKIIEFLLQNLGKLTLNHLGLVEEIGAPSTKGSYQIVNSMQELSLVSTEDSRKKADIYINGVGISLKQTGGSFSFNRLQRAGLLQVFSDLNFKEPEQNLDLLDKEVEKFHQGSLPKRNRPWETFFSEKDFKALLKFLMLKGSPNYGLTANPASYILQAPATNINQSNIDVFQFDEYFDKYKDKLKIAIRRQWVGQLSKSEHTRALGISKKPDNQPWVFDSVSGEPRVKDDSGSKWRSEFPLDKRKTVHILFIEKE